MVDVVSKQNRMYRNMHKTNEATSKAQPNTWNKSSRWTFSCWSFVQTFIIFDLSTYSENQLGIFRAMQACHFLQRNGMKYTLYQCAYYNSTYTSEIERQRKRKKGEKMNPQCEVHACLSNGPAHSHIKREREIYRIGFFYKKKQLTIAIEQYPFSHALGKHQQQLLHNNKK